MRDINDIKIGDMVLLKQNCREKDIQGMYANVTRVGTKKQPFLSLNVIVTHKTFWLASIHIDDVACHYKRGI